eukprot:2432131-Amphidinium_carterae.1
MSAAIPHPAACRALSSLPASVHTSEAASAPHCKTSFDTTQSESLLMSKLHRVSAELFATLNNCGAAEPTNEADTKGSHCTSHRHLNASGMKRSIVVLLAQFFNFLVLQSQINTHQLHMATNQQNVKKHMLAQQALARSAQPPQVR